MASDLQVHERVERLRDRVIIMQTFLIGAQEEVTRLMKELEPFTVLAPRTGKGCNAISNDEIARINADRLRKIKNKKA